MNPMTNIKNLNAMNKRELELGVAGTTSSWHAKYRDSAWVFVGGLPYDLSEGDVICVFSQYGEIRNINMPRDKDTGKQKGFAFVLYEDTRSAVIAVDNLNGIKILHRTIRVDHVENYRVPKEYGDEDEITMKLKDEGIAPQAVLVDHGPVRPEVNEEYVKEKKKKKKVKKEKEKEKETEKAKEKEKVKNEKAELKNSDPSSDKQYPDRPADSAFNRDHWNWKPRKEREAEEKQEKLKTGAKSENATKSSKDSYNQMRKNDTSRRDMHQNREENNRNYRRERSASPQLDTREHRNDSKNWKSKDSRERPRRSKERERSRSRDRETRKGSESPQRIRNKRSPSLDREKKVRTNVVRSPRRERKRSQSPTYKRRERSLSPRRRRSRDRDTRRSRDRSRQERSRS